MPVVKIMNLRDQLVQEHSKAQTMKIVNYVDADINRFNQLYRLFKEQDYRLSQRAAWSVNYCVENNPHFLAGRFGELIELLDQPKHDAIKRNILRMLQFVDIPDTWKGIYYDRCMQFVASSKEPIAVRCFSMEVMHNIATGIPELENELKLLLPDFEYSDSAGLRARSKNLLRKLARRR